MRVLNLAGVLFATLAVAQERPALHLDVPFVPSPNAVVEGMLKLAQVNSTDTVYDLGCGDGRIVIMAATNYKAHGVGVDIDPARIQEARRNAQNAGVENLVRFEQNDLFKVDIRKATVVTLYLLPNVNQKLKPKLLNELRPGSRIVSHSFDMGEWKPDREETIDGRYIYLWTVPEKKR